MKILLETFDDQTNPTAVLYDSETSFGMVSIVIDNMRFRIDEEQFAGSDVKYLGVNLNVDRGRDMLTVLPRAANSVFLTAEDQYR